MRRRTVHPLIWLILLLGVIGFVYVTFNQPVFMLRQILFIVLMFAAVYIIYQLLNRRRRGKDYSSYAKAVNQSKKLHSERSKKTFVKAVQGKATKKTPRPNLQKKRKTTHLTVIEGKKGKKKNRAFF